MLTSRNAKGSDLFCSNDALDICRLQSLRLSKDEPVRRFEVFTGNGRRREWSDDQKARIIAESCKPGVTVCSVARRHGLTPQQLFTWRRLARKPAELLSVPGEDSMFAPAVVVSPGKPLHTVISKQTSTLPQPESARKGSQAPLTSKEGYVLLRQLGSDNIHYRKLEDGYAPDAVTPAYKDRFPCWRASPRGR
ncbi:transposase [Rhizobium leguminosarum]